MQQREQVIQIRYHEGAFPPERHGGWIDLATPEDYKLTQGEFRILPLNVSMKLPDGYEAVMAPRSSTFKNYGILMANSIGVIENDYCGDDDVWGFPAYATRTVIIPAGTRICQFRIQRVMGPILFKAVPKLGDESRGGFGSSGKQVSVL
ncbi:dUTP diphosphatase [uncultured Bifidobacterium sp.]|uniref:dUTP diphosphatase n=1 Tax=uncultured Bifidobacterium sp. TaxID=165187 RepID=UPI0026177EF6|nr:deoxyuridine 5'-triphosphate nucleotidohydrolase [uncultured Bifidobacterium sp.]